MAQPAVKHATYADLEAVPPHLVAEIVYGVLETQPRPAPSHAVAAASLGGALTAPFQRGIGGPGGWIFMVEPELHLGADVVVPDIAAWRRERMTELPDTAFISTPPDWICEIVSPSTARLDRGPKRMIYAEAGVPFLWLVDPLQRVLEAFALQNRRWTLVASATDRDAVRAAPFDAITFPLDELWPFDSPSQPT